MLTSVSDSEKQRRRNKASYILWGIAWGLLIAAFIFVKTTGLRMVSGDSMVPTLHHGDIIITSGNFAPNDLKRGDIIMFDLGITPYRSVIKRIIGIPGDTITSGPDGFYLNGEKFDDEFGGVELLEDYSEEITLGDGEYYVLGDNRNGSSDSRRFGPVRFDQIKRKYVSRLFFFS